MVRLEDRQGLFKAANYNVIESVAANLAATWYEVGRAQGLTSKHPNARAYAKANLEKFIPKAVEYCLEMLNNPTFPDLAKNEIYEALLERNNDPTLQTLWPNVDVNRALELAAQQDAAKVVNLDINIPKPEKSLQQLKNDLKNHVHERTN